MMSESEEEVFKEEETDSDETNSEDLSDKRDKWGGKIEYFLSMLGYMVGLGNLWRFPYLCMRNGGGMYVQLEYFHLEKLC